MNKFRLAGFIRNLLRVVALLLFAGYFALTSLKTPFDFADPEIAPPIPGEVQVRMVMANEPYDHFRTGAASLLLGLLVGNALLSSASTERRRFAVAILSGSVLVAISTFFGVTSLATPLILLAIALYGGGVAFNGLRSDAGSGADEITRGTRA
jgi:hypothetical protein